MSEASGRTEVDTVVIAVDNDVIVCRLGGTEADTEVLVKVYAREAGERWLLSANEREGDRYAPRQIKKNERFEVLGVVVGRSGYGLPGSLAPRRFKGRNA